MKRIFLNLFIRLIERCGISRRFVHPQPPGGFSPFATGGQSLGAVDDRARAENSDAFNRVCPWLQHDAIPALSMRRVIGRGWEAAR